ncbi:DUF7576 family protein [Haladaptatus salinisoli]|uniref:DUF7576 family protein n=1 Tax=Haladaptatus salinisoli TaxID=2884876 RepID=UPI001D0B5B46|nr:hypothetical protein [Haladaptatus salinisoli]
MTRRSPGSDDASDERTCASCGERIELTAWHPVLAEPDASEALHLYPFCSADCRTAWNQRNTEND